MWFSTKKVKRNSIKQIVDFLKDNPCQSEAQILSKVFNFTRGGFYPNKKYADMLRRGLDKNLIGRVKVKNPKCRTKYYYFAIS